MGLDKAQLKMLIANDIGADLEDQLEGQRRAVYELSGAAQALQQAATKVPADLIARVDTELEEGAIKDGMSALAVIELIKKYLTRAGDFLSHLSQVEQQKSIVQAGRAAGLEDALKHVKRIRDTEAERIKQILDRVEAGDETALVNPRSSAQAARAAHGSLAQRRAAQFKRPEPVEKSIEDMNELELEHYLMQGAQ